MIVSHSIRPVPAAERRHHLDALRGAALLGVLMVNLLHGFRVSLFTSMRTFHSHPGWPNRAVDNLAAWIFEFKAFSLFSLLFGVGIGIQSVIDVVFQPDRAGLLVDTLFSQPEIRPSGRRRQ